MIYQGRLAKLNSVTLSKGGNAKFSDAIFQAELFACGAGV